MLRLLGAFLVLLWSLNFVLPGAQAQSEMPHQTFSQTIKGDLLAIKGHTYVIRDISGRLVFLQVDKRTKQDRPLLPGEKIEADVIPGEVVVSLRPAK
jgi:hypothetical protein